MSEHIISSPSTRTCAAFAHASPRWAGMPRKLLPAHHGAGDAATATGRARDRARRARWIGSSVEVEELCARVIARVSRWPRICAWSSRRSRSSSILERDRRSCQEHRQAGAQRGPGRGQPVRSVARMGQQALAQLNEVLDAFAAAMSSSASRVWRRDAEIDECLRFPLPRARDLHDGGSAHHHGRARSCCSSPRTSSGSATTPPTSPNWSYWSSSGEPLATSGRRARRWPMAQPAREPWQACESWLSRTRRPLTSFSPTTLEAAGYAVRVAGDGTRRQPPSTRRQPDLVLLDWMLPGSRASSCAAGCAAGTARARCPSSCCTARGEEDTRARAGDRRRRLCHQALLDAPNCARRGAALLRRARPESVGRCFGATSSWTARPSASAAAARGASRPDRNSGCWSA
ncbi:MAG: hypothetical protein KatS3mg118_0126 [Paracoccaceae bacterium]|nr:MAG: hypothetical protein KatS3mg118_0126 [Paracoccaceae bacterium]